MTASPQLLYYPLMSSPVGSMLYEPIYQALWKNCQAIRDLEDHLARNLGMSGHSDLTILVLLLDFGDQSVSWLGKKAGLTSGSMTAALDRLEAPGWVERHKQPEDRRRILVRMTRTGRKAALLARRQREKCLSRVFADFSEIEVNTLIRSLKKAGSRARGLKDVFFL